MRFVLLSLVLCQAAWGQQVSGFIQVDGVLAEDSVDQLNDADASALNGNRVLIRRARVRVSDEWRWLEYAAEAEFLTVRGPEFGARQLEVAVTWPEHVQAAPGDGGVSPPTPPSPPASVRLGAGLFKVPFGVDAYEVSDARYGKSQDDRLFAEPSLLVQAFFPGQFDLGARLSAKWKGLAAVVAVQNGEPLNTAGFPAVDPNSAKDFFARLTAHAEPFSWASLDVGTSLVVGTGFHAGTPATKDVLVWRDLNEDGIVQVTEIQAIRGSAGTVSENFERWGLGGDVRLKFALPFGKLTLFGEGALANNLDRAIRPADPILLGRAQRGLTGSAGFTQELFSHVLLGVRLDGYLPSLDDAQLAAGTLVRAQQPFTYVSFAAAVRFDGPMGLGRGRVLADYTLKRDPLALDASGRPTDLRNDVFTLRLQVEL